MSIGSEDNMKALKIVGEIIAEVCSETFKAAMFMGALMILHEVLHLWMGV
jgi:hypothetical protein